MGANSGEYIEVDFVQESADFNKNKILEQAGIFALTQKNIAQANVLNLLK